jgi:hypothetical protein
LDFLDHEELGDHLAGRAARPFKVTEPAARRGSTNDHTAASRFNSELQQDGIDGMAERVAGVKVGVKGFSRRRRCERREHP